MPMRPFALALLAASALLSAPAGGQGAEPDAPTAGQVARAFEGHKAVTRPSKDAVMGFSLPTAVREVLVAGGQRVAKGDLLLRGDDVEDVALLEAQKIRAREDLPVQRAVKQAELAEAEYAKALEAHDAGGISEIELDRARLAAATARIDVDIARNNFEQEVAAVDRFQARVDKFRIVAPFDGYVDIVAAELGQSIGDSEPAVRIVQVDPLWIDVPVPTGRTIALDLVSGSPAWVLMDQPGPARVHEARVVEVAPTADAASGTRRVRVEVPNPERLVAGLTCWVRFEPPSEGWMGPALTDAGPLSTTTTGAAR